MADKRLTSGQIASTSAQTVFTAFTDTRIYSIILTNTTGNDISVDVSVSDGSDTRLVRSTFIPKGSGKFRVITEVQAVSEGDTIIVQAGSTDAFNYYISGRQ